ncbi:MAG: hypothetical protein IKH37_06035 [Prevotella sp.]|nr:hypothetical protein [Prevotella sp.]
MAITLFSAKDFAQKLKVTIQASGKLGFTGETGNHLHLAERAGIKIAKDDEKDVLYLIIIDTPSEDAFELRSSSGYYSAETSRLFDYLGYDYSEANIPFDLVRQDNLDEQLGGEVYYMKRRTNKRKETFQRTSEGES